MKKGCYKRTEKHKNISIKNLGDYALKGKMVGKLSPSYGKKHTRKAKEKMKHTKLGKPQFQNRRKDIDKRKEEILDLYNNQNNSIKKISKLIGCSNIVIKRILKENKIKIKPQKYHMKRLYDKKIITPWNKGKKGIMPTPWNKDKRGYKINRIKKLSEDKKKKIRKYTKKAMNRPEVKKKMSKIGKKNAKSGKNPTVFKKGKLHPNWLGGKSFEPYGLEFNKERKEKTRKRDNYTCQECFKTEQKLKRILGVHHIDYNKQNNSPINLISLCVKCHVKTNGNRKHWENYFKMKIFIKELFNPENILMFNENKQLIGMEKINKT